jgi:hypothetical protein
MRKLTLLLVIAGCGDNTLSVPPETACTDFGKAFCGQIQSCSSVFMKLTYGDQATCEARLKMPCLNGLKDPGTTQTASRIDACAQKVMTSTCADLFAHVVPAECKAPAGPQADGTVCGDDGQCQHSYCKKTNSVCGVCATRTSTCASNDDCDSGLVCAGGTCTMRGAKGATCDDNHPCAYGLSCTSGTCATPPGAGMMCTANTGGGNCDTAQGYFCNPISNVCQAFSFGNAGDPCGLVNQSFVICAANGTCSGMLMGNCRAAAADGAACNDTVKCQAPAQCINSVCTLADTSTCK